MRRTGRHSDTEAERFARAVEADHRTEPPELPELPEATDPLDEATGRLVRVADRLRSGGAASASSEYKRRFREILLAPHTDDQGEPAGAARHRARRQPIVPYGRWLVGACATAIAMLLLAAATLLLSNGALPGDALYAVKRSTESVELALAQGEEARADRHLDFARARAQEMGEIVDRLGDLEPSSPSSARILATADDMDAETRSGVALVTAHAVEAAHEADLTGLLTWAADQRAVLDPLSGRLPSGLSERVGDSLGLLAQVRERAAALRAGLDCSCLGDAELDPLGPLPCSQCRGLDHPDERVVTARPSDRPPDDPVPPPTAAAEPTTSASSSHTPTPEPSASTPSPPGPLIPGLPGVPGLPDDIPVPPTPYGAPQDGASVPPPDLGPLPPGPLVPGLADGPEDPPDIRSERGPGAGPPVPVPHSSPRPSPSS